MLSQACTQEPNRRDAAVIVTNRVKHSAGHMPGTKLWQLKAFFTSHSLSLCPCSWSFYCQRHPHPHLLPSACLADDQFHSVSQRAKQCSVPLMKLFGRKEELQSAGAGWTTSIKLCKDRQTAHLRPLGPLPTSSTDCSTHSHFSHQPNSLSAVQYILLLSVSLNENKWFFCQVM